MPITRVTQGSEHFKPALSPWSIDGASPGADDVVVLWIMCDGNGTINSITSGFTIAGTPVLEAADDYETFVYTGKGSDVGAGPWSVTWSANTVGVAGWATYSGADTTNRVVGYVGNTSAVAGIGTVLDTPVATLTRAPAMLLGSATVESGSAVATTWDAENTEVIDTHNITVPGTFMTVAERRSTGANPQQLNGDYTSTATTKITLAIAEQGAFTPAIISHQSSGTTPTGVGVGTGTTSCAPNYPTSLVGDMLLMAVWIKPDTATAPTIASWTKVTSGEAGGGGGVTGADTGPTRLCWYYREVRGTPPTGTLTVTPGSTPNCCMAQMFLLRPSSGSATTWSVSGANGIDTTTGTPFTAAMGSNPGIDVNDMVLVAGGIPTDVTTPAQFSAETLTATSLLSGPVTEIAEPETTAGNQLGGVVCRWSPYQAASGVATFSAVAGGTTTNVRGPICLVRARASTTRAPGARRLPAAQTPPISAAYR